MSTFKTKAEATRFASKRKKGFINVARQEAKLKNPDKERIKFLKESVKTVKIRKRKFSDGDVLYFVEGR